MSFKRYVLESGGYCIQDVGKEGEIWEIRIKDENIRTRHAFYASQGKYNELMRYYREQLKKTKSQLTEPWVWDIIEDARDENLRIAGGIVAYFIVEGPVYKLKPIKQKVNSIEEIS